MSSNESHWDAAMVLEKQLKLETKKRSFWDPSMRKLRMDLQLAYERALLHPSSYEMAVAKDACELCWKSAFYRPIEEFRARIKIASQAVTAARESHSSSLEEIESQQNKLHLAFIKFLDESCSSYRMFIWKLDQIYREGSQSDRSHVFELSSREVDKATASLSGLAHSPSTPHSLPGLLNRCLVYLGDLYRYKSNAQTSIPAPQTATNGGRSDSWQRAIRSYQCAASMLPSSGNPFNQLAVMSYQAGDELRAVYFYFRSLKVSQPFTTARQNLLLLFEKNRTRFSTAHAGIQTRADGKVSSLADTSLSFVRLAGLFFDKINAQDYVQVKDLAFSSLDSLLATPSFLQSLPSSMAFDHLPLHLATLATFSADTENPKTLVVLIELVTSLLKATRALPQGNDQEHRIICSRLSAGALISLQLIGCNPQGLLQPVLDQIDPSINGRPDSEAFDIILRLLEAGASYARSVPGLYQSTSALEADDSIILPENRELVGFEPLRMVWEGMSPSALAPTPSRDNSAAGFSRVKQLLALLKWLGENIQTSLSSSMDGNHRVVRVRVSCQQLVDEVEGGLGDLYTLKTPPVRSIVDPSHQEPLVAHEAMEEEEEEEEVFVWQPKGTSRPSGALSPPPLLPLPPPLPTSLLGHMYQPQMQASAPALHDHLAAAGVVGGGLSGYHIEAVCERNLEATALRVAGDILNSDMAQEEDYSFLGMFAVPHNS